MTTMNISPPETLKAFIDQASKNQGLALLVFMSVICGVHRAQSHPGRRCTAITARKAK
jgi:hypothetical protein